MLRRRYLPHLEFPNSSYFVTFRLAGSIPKSVLDGWNFERYAIKRETERQKRKLSEYERTRLDYLFSAKIENYLHLGHGVCWLQNPRIAEITIDTLKRFDEDRYRLHAWCVMPNHVHVVFTAISKGSETTSDLIPILHSWKSYTAHQANKILARTGPFWQEEYYDRRIRGDEEFGHFINYTLQNPVFARFCNLWSDWQWSGCSQTIHKMMND